MANDPIDAWRQLKTHLESLRRAGLLDVPVGTWNPEEDVEPDSHFEAEPDSEPILNTVVSTGESSARNPIKPVSAELIPDMVERKPPSPPARPVRPPAPAVSTMFGHYLKPFERL